MLMNSVECFKDQEFHGQRSLIVDDDQRGDPGGVPHKYNRIVRTALGAVAPDLLIVWEDDDLYLPDHISRIVNAWELAGRPEIWWGHPSRVYSDYPGHVLTEGAAGRFHAALALTVGAWRECPWIETPRADFDQQWMGALRQRFGPPCDYLAGGDPTYVFRWHTGHHHGQSSMRSPDDVTWYQAARERLRAAEEARQAAGIPIKPGYDDASRAILDAIAAIRAGGVG